MSESQFSIQWIDLGREPKCQPNSEYPLGMDVGVSDEDVATCKVALPYPARRCGLYVVHCAICGACVGLTTAGRVDDPRSLTLSCKINMRQQ